MSLDSETNVQNDTPYKLVIYGTTELTDMSFSNSVKISDGREGPSGFPPRFLRK